MIKNYAVQQIIFHLMTQCPDSFTRPYNGEAQELNRLAEALEKRAQTLDPNSQEADALTRLSNTISPLLMTLVSMKAAHEVHNERRVRELLTRAMTQFGQLSEAYDSLKEQFPQVMEDPDIAGFDESFTNAEFEQGDDLIDEYGLEVQKYKAPRPDPTIEPVGLSRLTPETSFSAWYAENMTSMQEKLNAPVPSPMNPLNTPQRIYDHILVTRQANFAHNSIKLLMAQAATEFTDAEIRDYFRQCKRPEGKSYMTEEYLVNKIHEGPYANMFNPTAFGCSEAHMIGVFDQILQKKPQLRERLYSSVNMIKLPIDPGYKGPQEEIFDKALLDQRKQEWTSPEDQELLEQAEDIMTGPSEEVRAYLDTYFNAGDNLPSLDNYLGYQSDAMVQRGLPTLGGGQFQQYIQPVTANEKLGTIVYSVEHPDCRPAPFTEEARQQLRNTAPQLSPITVETLVEMEKIMDTMDFEGSPYYSSSTVQRMKPRREENGQAYPFHESEEGQKYYAFWPLMQKKNNLYTALQNGDKEKAREAIRQYHEEEEKADALMEQVRKDGLSEQPLFSANVNSTRPNNIFLPSKYMTDYPGHNKLNTFYNLYAPLKNAGISMQEFLTNPVTALEKMSRNYIETNGMASHSGSIGEDLAWNTQPLQEEFYKMYFVWMTQLDARGRMAIAALEPDPAKRDEFLAAIKMGQYSALLEIEKERDLMQVVENIMTGEDDTAFEQRNLLYQRAVLLPENEFSLKSFAETVQNDIDWRNTLSVQQLLRPENIANLNFAELANRPEKVLADFKAAMQQHNTFHSKFDQDDFIINTFGIYTQIIKNAPDEVKNSPEFQLFKQKTLALPELMSDVKLKQVLQASAEVMDIETPFNDLQSDKSDNFFNRDTDEYTAMKDSVRGIRTKLEQIGTLGTDPNIDADELRQGLDTTLSTAADNTFNYMRLKLKNGTKTSFSHGSGQRRLDEARATLLKIWEFQDKLGLRSPAQKLLDESRLELLEHRHDRAWRRQNLYTTVSKMIYARAFIDGHVPADKQAPYFRPETVSARVTRLIRTQNSARTYLLLHEDDKVANEALEQKGGFAAVVQRKAHKIDTQYQTLAAEEKLENTKETIRRRYALDLAAEEMGLVRADDARLSPKNQLLINRANELLQDDEFKRRMNLLMEGKTRQQIRFLHDDAGIDVDPMTKHLGYHEIPLKESYEQQCAAKLASLTHPGQAPTPEEISAMKQDPAFRTIFTEATNGKNVNQLNEALRQLNNPQNDAGLLQKFQQLKNPQPAPQQEGPQIILNQ